MTTIERRVANLEQRYAIRNNFQRLSDDELNQFIAQNIRYLKSVLSADEQGELNELLNRYQYQGDSP